MTRHHEPPHAQSVEERDGVHGEDGAVAGAQRRARRKAGLSEPAQRRGDRAQRRQLAGSLIGSIAETQEVLDLCAEHGVAPDVQVIPIQEVNDAYKRVKSGDVRFRYVIDMASPKDEARG